MNQLNTPDQGESPDRGEAQPDFAPDAQMEVPRPQEMKIEEPLEGEPSDKKPDNVEITKEAGKILPERSHEGAVRKKAPVIQEQDVGFKTPVYDSRVASNLTAAINASTKNRNQRKSSGIEIREERAN